MILWLLNIMILILAFRELYVIMKLHHIISRNLTQVRIPFSGSCVLFFVVVFLVFFGFFSKKRIEFTRIHSNYLILFYFSGSKYRSLYYYLLDHSDLIETTFRNSCMILMFLRWCFHKHSVIG